MPDFAISADPAVQAQFDRLVTLSPGADILGLDRITRLLGRLGDPHMRLPPVFHVAGTNGKGSTCAYLRAALEAAGLRVHVYASPHLVRFNERIRLAGTLIDDTALADLLREVLDVAEGIGASFFEITTAAAFVAFARTPADACVIEVGLGGRLDATNVLPAPAACGIAALGIDHEAFLGSSLVGIAGEKAGIAKPGVPIVTLAYPPEIAARVAETVAVAGGVLVARGDGWDVEGGRYRDAAGGLDLPEPALAGRHQRDNLALATAMLRHQSAVHVPDAAIVAGGRAAHWPARMQRLRPGGPLTGRVDPRHGVWLDGAHNESAAIEVARVWPGIARGERSALVLGMLTNKDAGAVLRHLAEVVDHVVAVPVPGHAHHAPADLAKVARGLGLTADVATDPAAALDLLARSEPEAVLIAGSLYLAGTVLAANDEVPV
ncbi:MULTISPECIES: bifunctional folylpolyglutamate synthase/dihydrofolate synthase [Sphingomonas]|jgi:dihydrofolate synthase/folylpolyglutamate synthase|uniref:Dihydrofolate synthase/folylpolyglutamate synthase n=1 Tax=Sphingomonas hankookensis TaxID=563996 RepID=A0ABR5YG59_9SPHN|nr:MULTISPECIES: bifunctional folylpolyglutamate synthase/dihydrofolate synthase [Sphingomonas]KZE18508.1 bifunctional folylpolyglutamate synthase/dihydrofolate synthase [Sphingomonas hankookensis]PZT95054.1 MAG: bifunctional folylpolyglutamate synthase/dihydrofolate synthase [Sphingomonas sp.]RSV32767.1 bifunctional folylpolyglutamate synthase/dihydrofolate synthase [Sphingomonas sp. ABOLH]WCP73412.1 bifunctional folylpolyglutamate synthase/dihydrofolate synthase [Sphingomonas hankookensis]